jgi:UDP-N-acetylglucosamine--N-acetylmuramyl-(pentapeptide) pyrophosphoryl-undecaprenol N-acetylglucosamine transferase
MGIRTWAHEAEKHPGLANRVLSYFSHDFSVAFDGTKLGGWSRVTVTGHPVRQELKAIDRDAIPREAPTRLLVLGGSQGARGLDIAVPTLGALFNERGIEVVHQSRPEAVTEVSEAYKKVGVSAHVVPFIEDMIGAYEWSDVVISRAGASSVAELACVNRPTIFVPYPHQQGTHQTDNAKTLVVQEKAYLVEEIAPDFPQRLREALVELITPSNFIRMKKVPYEPKGLGAAEAIAKGVLGLAS